MGRNAGAHSRNTRPATAYRGSKTRVYGLSLFERPPLDFWLRGDQARLQGAWLLRLEQHGRISQSGSGIVCLRRTRETANAEAECARLACDGGADCPYQDPRKWNRVETERKRTRCRPVSTARHGIVATQHGNARQIAPIRVIERRSRWPVAAATGNRQAEGSVSTRITWHAGGDAVGATASTWHHHSTACRTLASSWSGRRHMGRAPGIVIAEHNPVRPASAA
jgi:hypothetical protein